MGRGGRKNLRLEDIRYFNPYPPPTPNNFALVHVKCPFGCDCDAFHHEPLGCG